MNYVNLDQWSWSFLLAPMPLIWKFIRLMLTATIGRALIQQSIGVTIFHFVSASDWSRRKLNFSVYISFANIFANNLRVIMLSYLNRLDLTSLHHNERRKTAFSLTFNLCSTQWLVLQQLTWISRSYLLLQRFPTADDHTLSTHCYWVTISPLEYEI